MESETVPEVRPRLARPDAARRRHPKGLRELLHPRCARHGGATAADRRLRSACCEPLAFCLPGPSVQLWKYGGKAIQAPARAPDDVAAIRTRQTGFSAALSCGARKGSDARCWMRYRLCAEARART